MNYDSIKTHLENAHRILIRTGDELDLQNLAVYSASLGRKDWRTAISALEECGASADCDAEFWVELLNAARELELPRYVARIEKWVGRSGNA
jgi:hypothetical protein